MLGVPKELIEHSLNIDPKATQRSIDYIITLKIRGKPSRRS
jgi:hypothetical protein